MKRFFLFALIHVAALAAEIEIDGVRIGQPESELAKLGFVETREKGTYVLPNTGKSIIQVFTENQKVCMYMFSWDVASLKAQGRDPDALCKELHQKLEAYFEEKIQMSAGKDTMKSMGKKYKDGVMYRHFYSADRIHFLTVRESSAVAK